VIEIVWELRNEIRMPIQSELPPLNYQVVIFGDVIHVLFDECIDKTLYCHVGLQY